MTRSYSIETGNLVLLCNWIQLRPAAPPKDIPMQNPPLPLAQPLAPAAAVCIPNRQLAAMPLQADRPNSLPPAEPQQGVQEIVQPSAVPSCQPINQIRTSDIPTKEIQGLCSLLEGQ